MFVLMVYIYLAYDVRALTSTTKVSFETSSTNFTGHSNLWNVTSTSSDIFRSTTTFLNIINTSTSSTFYDNTECFQNEPINHFLVITRIQLLPNDNSSSADFKSDLESKLTAIYREAQALRNSSSLNISAIIFNVTERSGGGGQSEVDILYYLLESSSDPRNESTCLSAESTKFLMDFVLETKGLQYLTLMIGRIVSVPILLFLVQPIERPEHPERIGAIAGGIASSVIGCLLIMWLILYCYFKCQFARKVYCNKGVMCQMDEQPIYDVKNVGDRPMEAAEVSPSDKQALEQSKVDEATKKEKKKLKKKSKQKQPRQKTLPTMEDPNVGSLSGSNVSPLGLDEEQATQDEIKSTPPLLDNVPTNVHPPTGTFPSLSPLFHVVGRSLAVWNPHRAADESRRIMEEHKKNQTTNNNTRTTSPTHSESAQPIGKGVAGEGPIEKDELHLGPISRADERAKLNLIRLLRERGMLDENYSSVVLDSRVYL